MLLRPRILDLRESAKCQQHVGKVEAWGNVRRYKAVELTASPPAERITRPCRVAGFTLGAAGHFLLRAMKALEPLGDRLRQCRFLGLVHALHVRPEDPRQFISEFSFHRSDAFPGCTPFPWHSILQSSIRSAVPTVTDLLKLGTGPHNTCAQISLFILRSSMTLTLKSYKFLVSTLLSNNG